MRSLLQLAVVAVTVVTLTLAAAVGVSAHSGAFGSHHATSVSILNSHLDLGFLREGGGGNDGEGSNHDRGGRCEGTDDHHDHGTPGHKNHPCGKKGDDTD